MKSIIPAACGGACGDGTGDADDGGGEP